MGQFKFAATITIILTLVVLIPTSKASLRTTTTNQSGDDKSLQQHEHLTGESLKLIHQKDSSIDEQPRSPAKLRRSTTSFNQEDSELQIDRDHQILPYSNDNRHRQLENSEPLQEDLSSDLTNGKSDKTLSRELVKNTCHLYKGSSRIASLNYTYLMHCDRYKIGDLLSSEVIEIINHRETADCERVLNEFIELDELIDKFDVLFKKLLTRYNCHNGYSVKWTCEDCKVSVPIVLYYILIFP